jgi:hypothetical protein
MCSNNKRSLAKRLSEAVRVRDLRRARVSPPSPFRRQSASPPLTPIVTTGLAPVVHAAKNWISGSSQAMTRKRGSVSGHRSQKLIPAPQLLRHTPPTPAQAARSRRTIGAGDRMEMGSPVFRSRVWRPPHAIPGDHVGPFRLHRTAAATSPAGRRRSSPSWRNADAVPPTQRAERASGAWGEVFLTYTLSAGRPAPRRTSPHAAALRGARQSRQIGPVDRFEPRRP